MRAAAEGDRTEARRLLASGVDVDEGVVGHGTPLILAAAAGDERMVELLIEAGADVNRTIDVDEPGTGLLGAPLSTPRGTDTSPSPKPCWTPAPTSTPLRTATPPR